MCVCVCETSAALSILLQEVSARARAGVRSLCVLADEVARLRCLNALVYVCEREGRRREIERPTEEFDARVRNSIRGNEEPDRRVCGQSTHVVTAARSLLDSRNEKTREHQAP